MWTVDIATIESELMIFLNAKNVNSMCTWSVYDGLARLVTSLGKLKQAYFWSTIIL